VFLCETVLRFKTWFFFHLGSFLVIYSDDLLNYYRFRQVTMIRMTKEMAQQLVEFISGETGFNMIVCDTDGVIIGDRSKERFGVRHEGAVRIMKGDFDSIAITREEAERSEGKMREGYNIVIKVDEERIGTFGIGGPVEIVKPIAKIAAAVIAARIQENRHLELIGEVVGEISRSV